MGSAAHPSPAFAGYFLPIHRFGKFGVLRSRWRLCRLTDAACPSRGTQSTPALPKPWLDQNLSANARSTSGAARKNIIMTRIKLGEKTVFDLDAVELFRASARRTATGSRPSPRRGRSPPGSRRADRPRSWPSSPGSATAGRTRRSSARRRSEGPTARQRCTGSRGRAAAARGGTGPPQGSRTGPSRTSATASTAPDRT